MGNVEVLRREIGVLGAIFLGLGSILGTGVFVSIGLVIGQVGVAVILKTGVIVYVCVFVVHQVMEHILDSFLE